MKLILAVPGIAPADLKAVSADRLGVGAARVLDQLMRGEQPENGILLVKPPGVADRQSTDAMAMDDADVVAASKIISASCSILRSRLLGSIPLSTQPPTERS